MSEAATTNPVEAGAPAPADLRAKLAARWGTLAPRERSALLVAGAALALLAAWLLLVQPAWHTLRDAPAELDRLDAQVQEMRRLAAEARELRATAPVAPGQSAQALQAATQRLGGRGRLNLLGDRATLTLDGVAPDALADWLAEARRAARARPLEAQMVRAVQGYNGSIVLAIGGAP